MVIRNGILSTVRSRGRTILFALLIFLLTLSLSLGLGLWSYCAQTLAAMDATYTSIALVEYKGENYPDQYASDETARMAFAQLGDYSQVPGVELWEPTQWGMVLADGYRRPDGTIPYENRMVVSVFQLSEVFAFQECPAQLEDLPEEYLILSDDRCSVHIHAGVWEDIPYYTYTPPETPAAYVTEQMDGTITLVDEEQNLSMELNWLKNQEGFFRRDTYIETDPETGKLTAIGSLVNFRLALDHYQGIIGENLYSYDGTSGVLVEVHPGESGFVAEKGKRYLIHGERMDGGTSAQAIVVREFYEGCEQSPWVSFDRYDDPLFTDSLFSQYAKKYDLGNNYIQVEASDNIPALEPFQQGTLYLKEGRYPQAGETGVCTVTQDIAQQLDLELGDELPVSVMQSAQTDPFALEETGDSRTWTVVGIVNQSKGYEGHLWVSRQDALPHAPLFGYLFGRAVLDNDEAVEAVEQMAAMAPDGVEITLYDQGYATAAQPLQAMEATAQGVTFASLAGSFAVLCLFAFLFVGRQQQAVDVMVSLGTPKRKIWLWLLSGVTVVAGVAVLAGMVVSAISMQLLIWLALQGAQALYAADQRYSNGALGTTKEAELPQQVPLWPAWVAAVIVFLLALVLCAVFTRVAQRKNTLNRGKSRVRAPRSGTSTAGKGAVRFALLSARRGGWRSVVVPVVTLVLSGFLGFLMVTALGWGQQRDTLYENTTITGQFTSVNGRQYTGLMLEDPWHLWDSGLLSSMQVYDSTHFWIPDEMPDFPNTTFGNKLWSEWVSKQPELIFLNGLEVSPKFAYGQVPAITWLEGWDESFLEDPGYYNTPQSTPLPCIASQTWLEEQGIHLGDDIEINVQKGGTITVFPVGSYALGDTDKSIYVPLSRLCLPPWQAENPQQSAAPWEYFPGCRFTLRSSYDLEQCREYLAQEGYSVPGDLNGSRIVVVLNDYAFTQTVEALGRYITLSQILFPVLFLLMGVMGFVVSWLMVNSRRMEFAIMRGLGASPKRVFGSFFLEQMGLCLTGCVVSGVILGIWSGQPVVWLTSAGFALFYLAGCALAVRTVGKTKVFTLLTHAD